MLRVDRRLGKLVPDLCGRATKFIDSKNWKLTSDGYLSGDERRCSASKQQHSVDAVVFGQRAVERRLPILTRKEADLKDLREGGFFLELHFSALGFSEANSDFAFALGKRPCIPSDNVRLERLIVGEIDHEAEIGLCQFLANLFSDGFGGS